VTKRKKGKEKEKEERRRKEEKRELYVISSENVHCWMGIVNPVLEVLGSTILDRRGSESICRGNICKTDYSRIT